MSETIILLAGFGLILTALVPNWGRRHFVLRKADNDPIGLFFFAMPLGVMSFLFMGLKECVNLDVVAASDLKNSNAGARRRRMTPGQVRWALATRCVVFAYACATPALLIFGPWGVTSKARRYGHYPAEVTAIVLASTIALLTAFLISDGAARLRALAVEGKGGDLEGLKMEGMPRAARPVC